MPNGYNEAYPDWRFVLTTTTGPALGTAVTLTSTVSQDVGFVFRAPIAMTLTGCKFKITVVGSPGTFRVSVQTVSLTNGLNTGTILGATANAKKDVSGLGSGDSGVYTVTFDEAVVLAQGDLFCVYVKPMSGTWDAGNSIAIVPRITGFQGENTPYHIANAAKGTNALQQIILVCSGFETGICVSALSTVANVTSGSNPNEIGNYFLAPAYASAMECWGIEVGASISANRTIDLGIYSADSGTLLASVTGLDTDAQIAGAGVQTFPFTTSVALTPGVGYIVAIKAAHASGTFSIYGVQWASTGDKEACMEGQTVCWAERAGGVWTYDQTKIATVRPKLRALTGGNAGGGPLIGGRLVA